MIEVFMDQTKPYEEYGKELAYTTALSGRGNTDFSAEKVPLKPLSLEKRARFERAVRDGQLETAARIIGLEQLGELRAVVRCIGRSEGLKPRVWRGASGATLTCGLRCRIVAYVEDRHSPRTNGASGVGAATARVTEMTRSLE